MPDPALERLVAALDRYDLYAVSREDLDDAGTHSAEADDAHFGELASHTVLPGRSLPRPPEQQ